MSIRRTRSSAANIAEEVRAATTIAVSAERALRAVDDERGAAAAQSAQRTMAAPGVSVVIAGEYQQGKSALLNALLGARVSPTDPLTTTAVPIRVRAGPGVAFRAHLQADDTQPAAVQEITADEHQRLATAIRPTLAHREVVGLDIELDHPLLRSGLSFVDTPPTSGGLSTAKAGAVLGLLQSANALLFVTDASQELTAPEVELLRMARTLCPTLLVALTKTDLYPQWRRILDVNHELVADIDPDAVVLPVSAPLRAAAARTGEAELDRESGVPLLVWYLSTTHMAAARHAAIARAGNTLVEHLAAAIETVEERLAVLEESAGLRNSEARYRALAERIERLRSEAPRRVRLELRSFAQATRSDLMNRFAAASEAIGDLVDRSDPADSWPEIEAALHRAANRALAEHLTYLRSRAEGVVSALVDAFGLETGRLQLDLGDMAPTHALSPDLDQPEFTSAGAARVHDIARGAVITGSMGFGIATVLTGGLAALAIAAGATVSTTVLTSRRERSRDVAGRRSQALQVCKAWLNDARVAVAAHADDTYKELEFQLESQIERGLQQLLADSETERARLEELAKVRAELVPAEVASTRARLAELRKVHAHARRLPHRLARPDMAVTVR